MIGLVLSCFGLLASLSLPVLVLVGLAATPGGLAVIALTLALDATALLVSMRGRVSRLFGVAITGIIVSLFASIVTALLLVYSAAAQIDISVAGIAGLLAGPLPSQSGAEFRIRTVAIDGKCGGENCNTTVTVENVGRGAGHAEILVEISDGQQPILGIFGPRILADTTCASSELRSGSVGSVHCTPRTGSGVQFPQGKILYPRARVVANG
jgi:hypothetical protein